MLTYLMLAKRNSGDVPCSVCGGWIDSLFYPIVIDNRGVAFCEECAKGKVCPDCGWHIIDGGREGTDDRVYCRACFDESFFHCYSCDEVFNREEVVINEGGDGYCNACYNETYDQCASCDNECRLENMREHNDSLYCPECRDNIETWSPAGFNGCQDYSNLGSKRIFGLEIETNRCSDYWELDGSDAWGAQHDCSICGEEFYSDKLYGNDGLAAIDELIDFAESHDWGVDRRCGFHLHIDARGDSHEQHKAIACAAYLTYEVWCKFIDPDRIGNRYCQSIQWSLNDLSGWQEDCRLSRSYDRFQWFNLDALYRHSSYEVRLHEGTLDALTIKNWTRAWLVFADWAAQHSFDDVKDYFRDGSTEAKFRKLCKIWINTSCADLAEYYADKGGFDKERLSVYTRSRINELVSARGF